MVALLAPRRAGAVGRTVAAAGGWCQDRGRKGAETKEKEGGEKAGKGGGPEGKRGASRLGKGDDWKEIRENAVGGRGAARRAIAG